MAIFKKDKKKELEDAKKLIQKEEAIEEVKAEQAEPNPIVNTNSKAEGNQPTKEELETIKEGVEYYSQNYRGLFNPTDTPTVNPMESEIACLLFGILQEVRNTNMLLLELSKQG